MCMNHKTRYLQASNRNLRAQGTYNISQFVVLSKRVFGQRFGFINLLKPLFSHSFVDLFSNNTM